MCPTGKLIYSDTLSAIHRDNLDIIVKMDASDKNGSLLFRCDNRINGTFTPLENSTVIREMLVVMFSLLRFRDDVVKRKHLLILSDDPTEDD